ncbi:LAMI_0F01926g1_1 [Lachancea mirantina]|uniref:LAMI_0F01926g1_1 n=1 Tax=Lachancea mirantina TaxID=1230905 RepID=A0A1G4JW69_9SACH|nr:LAMI_0F01926g1_1 [Lachancea mirantina]
MAEIFGTDVSSETPDDEELRKNSTPEEKVGWRRRLPKPFAGIVKDVRDRLPYYWSDWKDAWDYRVIPSLLETFFNNLLPAIAFAQDMFDRTDHAYGVNEVLLSSAMGGIVFGVLAGQPLCIVGVTGPICIFSYTVYEIIKPLNTDFFGFMFWIYIWSMIFHFLLAAFNVVCLLQYVSTYPCDIFGLFINVVYVEKGIQILIRQFEFKGKTDLSAGYASITVALVMTIFGLAAKLFVYTPFFNYRIRTFVSDYATALSVVFWSAFTFFGGYLNDVHFQRLPITKAFHPTSVMRDRSTWLAYTSISVKDVFIALPFGIILTILFYFDHNVSSLMAQRYQYRLTKPATFHYDFLLLGATTAVSGVLGIPPPNGLIPQAPMHTETLLVRDENGNVLRCVEQRFTNTFQGVMTLCTMARPFLICLGQIPQAVLAGLFFIMGIQGLVHNTIIHRIVWIFTDPKKKSDTNPLGKVRIKKLALFVTISLAGFIPEFAITNTKGTIGFPLVLLITVAVSFSFPKFFTEKELAILEKDVAEEFVKKNLIMSSLTEFD